MSMNIIKKIVLEDGTELDASALRLVNISSKGNVEIKSLPTGDTDWGDGSKQSKGNLNIESSKNIKFKPGSGGQIEMVADNTGDLDEIVLKAITSVDENGEELSDDLTIRLKINCSELELNTKDAEDESACDLKFRKGKSSNKKYTKGRLKAKSIDIRAMADEGKGSGGGIAVQIASCDSDYHENKFKIETSRKKDIFEGLPSSALEYEEFYNSEGGEGIEIGTINSQAESFYTKEIRRCALSQVFASKRGAVTLDGTKLDYPTQSDDFKDIKINNSTDSKVLWIDIINAALYLKANNLIPNNDNKTLETMELYSNDSE